MAWLKIDDRVRTHPKIVEAGPAAAWLWFCGICYCREHLTDGFIQKLMLPTLAPGLRSVKSCAKRLVEVGLWHDKGSNYEVHDFLDWNPKRDDVEADREWDRRRKELYTEPGLTDRIRARDCDCCRYCGIRVNWKDRRGEGGGQFDHVVPRGPNSLENVVVACRGCNFKKGGRTPEQAGMPLLPAPSAANPGTSSGTSSGLSSESGSESVPLARDASARGLGLGSVVDSGRGPGKPRPATLVRPRNPNAVFEHPRFEVLYSWHNKRVLGLSDGEPGMRRFYEWLAARVDRTGEDTEPRFPWLQRCFDEWIRERMNERESGGVADFGPYYDRLEREAKARRASNG